MFPPGALLNEIIIFILFFIVLVSGVEHCDSVILQIILHQQLLKGNGYNFHEIVFF